MRQETVVMVYNPLPPLRTFWGFDSHEKISPLPPLWRSYNLGSHQNWIRVFEKYLSMLLSSKYFCFDHCVGRLVFPRHQFGNSQVKSTLISIGNGQLILTSSSTGGNGRQTPNCSSLAGTCQKTLEVNISMREANFHITITIEMYLFTFWKSFFWLKCF